MSKIIKNQDGSCTNMSVDENGVQYEPVPCPSTDTTKKETATAPQDSFIANALATMEDYASKIAKSFTAATQPKIVRYSDGTCYASEVDEFGRHSWKTPCP